MVSTPTEFDQIPVSGTDIIEPTKNTNMHNEIYTRNGYSSSRIFTYGTIYSRLHV